MDGMKCEKRLGMCSMCGLFPLIISFPFSSTVTTCLSDDTYLRVGNSALFGKTLVKK